MRLVRVRQAPVPFCLASLMLITAVLGASGCSSAPSKYYLSVSRDGLYSAERFNEAFANFVSVKVTSVRREEFYEKGYSREARCYFVGLQKEVKVPAGGLAGTSSP